MAHPYDVYAELRREAPVSYFEPADQWLIARHADVDELLRDRRLGRSYLHVATDEEFGRPPEPEFQEPFWRVVRSRHARRRAAGAHPAAPPGVQGVHPAHGRVAAAARAGHR
ncbi:hypothetical protein ACFSTC_61135 [Nonomuraea ferruginea]